MKECNKYFELFWKGRRFSYRMCEDYPEPEICSKVAYDAGWRDALEWILKHRSLMFGGFEEWWKEIQSCSEVSGISYPYPKNEAKAIWKAGFEESVKSIKNTLKTELEPEQIKHET